MGLIYNNWMGSIFINCGRWGQSILTVEDGVNLYQLWKMGLIYINCGRWGQSILTVEDGVNLY